MKSSFDVLEQFAQQLLEKAGFTDVPEEDRKSALGDMITQLEQRIGNALISAMSEESAVAFTKMLDEDPSPEKQEAFWKEHVPNFDVVIKGELDAFQEEFIKTLEGVRAE